MIPIRPGKELAAANWLKQVEVEGAAGLDKHYAAPSVRRGPSTSCSPVIQIAPIV